MSFVLISDRESPFQLLENTTASTNNSNNNSSVQISLKFNEIAVSLLPDLPVRREMFNITIEGLFFLYKLSNKKIKKN